MCCKEWSKKKLCVGGFISVMIFAAVGVVVLVMSGVNLDLLLQDFKSGAFQSLGLIQLVAMFYVMAIAGIGIIAFCCKDKCWALLFVILLFISFLFTAAVAVLGFIGGTVDAITSSVDCRSNLTGIVSIWNGMDAYLIEADKTLCSTNCACGLTNITAYSSYATYMTDYKIIAGGPTNFTACSDSSKTAAYDAAVKQDSRLDSDQSFNAAGFAKAFAWIETTFKCTGWCQTSYEKVSGSGVKTPLFKYLYNDINLGPATTAGCLTAISTSIPKFLIAYAVIAAVLASGQFVALMFGCSLCLADDLNEADLELIAEEEKAAGGEDKPAEAEAPPS